MFCFKCCLIGQTSSSKKYCDVEYDLMNDVVLSQKVSEQKNFSVLLRHYPCDILGKESQCFCPCLESLPEAKMRSFRLITLIEEISKQPIYFFLRVTSVNSYEDI